METKKLEKKKQKLKQKAREIDLQLNENRRILELIQTRIDILEFQGFKIYLQLRDMEEKLKQL